VGVVYDLEGNRQCFLKCHSNPILSTAVSKDRRWLITADVGKDCCLTVWDSFSGVPVKTIYDDLGTGIVATAFSHDAKYIVTIGQASPQKVSIWDWTSEKEGPCCTAVLSGITNKQETIAFSEDDVSQLVSNGDEQVIFYHWGGAQISHHAPELTDHTFNKALGFITVSSFISGTNLALSGTTEGSGVVWEVDRHARLKQTKEPDAALDGPHIRKAMKLMKMHTSPITALTTVDSFLVTGDSAGEVKFYDSELKLINWYDSFKYGPVASISFGFTPKATRYMGNKKSDPFSSQSTIEGRLFSAPDFTISTTTANVAYVSVLDISSQLLFSEHDASVNALATHPKESRVLIGSYSSKLKLWDYEDKAVMKSREFSEIDCLQCVSFDPKGYHVGVGCTDGTLYIVDAVSLEDVCEPFKFSKDCITHVTFSHDSRFIATADLDYCVTVYTLGKSREGDLSWSYLGKYRSHYKPITGLLFTVQVDTGAPRLLSLGQDRHLIEYDLVNSSEDDLRLLASNRIEQSAVPLAVEVFPPVTKEPFLVTANDQYKLKLYNTTTKMCRRTLLGPLYGSPLRKLAVLPHQLPAVENGVENRRHMAYITKDKVGLVLLPHDGNPHNTVAFTAHPSQVTDIRCSHDGRYIFTSGGEDCTVTMWKVNTEYACLFVYYVGTCVSCVCTYGMCKRIHNLLYVCVGRIQSLYVCYASFKYSVFLYLSSALETSVRLGGEGLVPFYRMLDGGRDGTFFAELEDYFYYAQIKSQGPCTVETRKTSTTIPLDQVPNVMRAIGYYPTEQEVSDMLNEVKFSEYVDTGKYITAINLGDFIKLYVNHRPAFGLSPHHLLDAFRALGSKSSSKEWSIPRGQLLSLLQDSGENIPDVELVEHLMTLLGYCSDPEVAENYTDSPDEALATTLPSDISISQFAQELLGLEL
jgi:WD40 repeat protein